MEILRLDFKEFWIEEGMVHGDIHAGNVSLFPEKIAITVEKGGFVAKSVKVKGHENAVRVAGKVGEAFSTLFFLFLIE